MFAYIKKKDISGHQISGLSPGLKDLKDTKLKFAFNFISFYYNMQGNMVSTSETRWLISLFQYFYIQTVILSSTFFLWCLVYVQTQGIDPSESIKTCESSMRSLYNKSHLLLKTKLNVYRCEAEISFYFTRKWIWNIAY